MSDWADEAAAKIIFDLATRYPTDGFGRMPCSVIADALRSRIAALEAELAAADIIISRFNSGQELQDSLARENALVEALAAEKVKVAKLREAVEPFASYPEMADEIRLPREHLRRARRIHEETA